MLVDEIDQTIVYVSWISSQLNEKWKKNGLSCRGTGTIYKILSAVSVRQNKIKKEY